MDIDFSEAYEVMAREMQSHSGDFWAALWAGCQCLMPDDPSGASVELLEDIYERRLVHAASVGWVAERSGMLGSVSISLLPLTPDSVWLLRHALFDENEFEFIREFPSLAAAQEGVSNEFLNLLGYCGLPDLVALPTGFSTLQYREVTEARLTRGKWDLSPSPWTWDGVAKSLRSITDGSLPHETDSERQTLLDQYVEVSCST